MKNRLNVWRQAITSIPRCKMLYCKVLITRATNGWRWRIMRDTDQVDTGVERTKDDALLAASVAKKRAMAETTQEKAITI